jgi:hypothetical protein
MTPLGFDLSSFHPAVGRVRLRNAVSRVRDRGGNPRKMIPQALTHPRERIRRLAKHFSSGSGDAKELASVQHSRDLHTRLNEDRGRAELACQRPAQPDARTAGSLRPMIMMATIGAFSD